MTNFAAWLSAALLLTSCATPLDAFTVSVADGKAHLGAKSYPVALSYCGTGGKPGSNRTPLGEFTVISKEPHHRYGEILRLGGVSNDGYRQDDRGILIHRARWEHTHGCIGVLSERDMSEIFEALNVGDRVRVM